MLVYSYHIVEFNTLQLNYYSFSVPNITARCSYYNVLLSDVHINMYNLLSVTSIQENCSLTKHKRCFNCNLRLHLSIVQPRHLRLPVSCFHYLESKLMAGDFSSGG